MRGDHAHTLQHSLAHAIVYPACSGGDEAQDYRCHPTISRKGRKSASRRYTTPANCASTMDSLANGSPPEGDELHQGLPRHAITLNIRTRPMQKICRKENFDFSTWRGFGNDKSGDGVSYEISSFDASLSSLRQNGMGAQSTDGAS